MSLINQRIQEGTNYTMLKRPPARFTSISSGKQIKDTFDHEI